MRVSAPGNPEPCVIPLPNATSAAAAGLPAALAAGGPQPPASSAASVIAGAAARAHPPGDVTGHGHLQSDQAPSQELPVVFAASSYSAADVAARGPARDPAPSAHEADGAVPGRAPERGQVGGGDEGAPAADADRFPDDDSDAGSNAASFTGSLVSSSGGRPPHLGP